MKDDPQSPVILVDETDKELGVCDKLTAHQQGRLHRAFSIFVFDSRGQWLIQQRAGDKYHSGGLWSNTCCSHPPPSRDIRKAARASLRREMGIECDIHEVFVFIYEARFDNGLTEHELDHVFIGTFDGEPRPDAREVADWMWVDTGALSRSLERKPDMYTYWFGTIFKKVQDHMS